MRELTNEANKLGLKIWNRSRRGMNDVRIFTQRQFDNLSRDEQSLVRSGWLSWAYCEFGLDQEANEIGFRLIVRK